jgi:type II secretory pathway pseudopilin PulG
MKLPHERSDSGETYVELLVTLVIIGLVGVAILGAVMTTITSSTVHRNLANDDSIMKSALERAKYQIESSPTPLFTECDGTHTASWLLTNWNSGVTWPAIPGGIGSYQAWISKVECFTESPSTSALDGTCQASQIAPGGAQSAVSSGGCANDSSGIIQVTVSVLDQSNLKSAMSTLVRNPSYGATYQSGNFG